MDRWSGVLALRRVSRARCNVTGHWFFGYEKTVKESTYGPGTLSVAVFVVAALVFTVWMSVASCTRPPLETGDPAPHFQAARLTHPQDLRSLPQYRDKVVLMTFWTTWCRGCKDVLRHAEKLRQEFGSEAVKVVAVSVDSRRRVDLADSIARSISAEIDWLHNPTRRMYRDYGVNVLGMTYLIDRDGMIRKRVYGPTLLPVDVAEALAAR